MAVPLEDLFNDVIGKAQRGLGLTDDALARQAGVSRQQLALVKDGTPDLAVLERLAQPLQLGRSALLASAQKAWNPEPQFVNGLACFNTAYEDMTVNAYVVWDPQTKSAAVFDTGADAGPIVEFIRGNQLTVLAVFLTHTNIDHVVDLDRLRQATGAPAWVSAKEGFDGAQAFDAGHVFEIGQLRVETRQTWGHARGGITYVVRGLEKNLAVVGDALFAGSMGGGMISYADALRTNREEIFSLPDATVLCPGHGPLTTVGEEMSHNPFFPEFQTQSTPEPNTAFMSEKIGFVGVGRMGANMARRLKECGFTVSAVYDVRQEIAQTLAQELGAQACADLAQVTALSDIVMTVVTDDQAMKKIFGSSGDRLLKRAKGRLFINCATVSPKIHLKVEEACQKAGAQSLEACMASSITQAREGSLYLMCAGPQSAFERAQPVLEKLSASMRYIGASGQAAKVKALVNMVMNINTAGLAEGLGLGAALGLDLAMLREVFSQTGANSRVLQTDGEDMQNRDHSCFFSAAHAAKDSGIAVSLAREQGLKLPLSEATKKQYERMIAEGLGELDKSGVAELTFKGRRA
jgi:3-hydroxyisobutyrate dehydrogenase